MYKYNRLALLLVLSITILSSVSVSAQQRTYSPLSRYGYGELQNISYSGYGAMGHTGIAFQSSYGINNLNPAANTAMDSLSFYFDAGMSFFWQKFASQGSNAENSNAVFDYIALGFSINPKASLTAGFKPFTSTGYNFETIEDFGNTASYSRLYGEGSLTQMYVGLSYAITKHLSLGANVNYIFGNIENIAQASFSDANALKYGTHRKIKVASPSFDFGAQYKINLDEKRNIIIGATFQPKQGLKGDTTAYKASGTTFGDENNLFSTSNGAYVDTISYETGSFDGGDFELPAKLGLGISYNIEDKLKVGFDYQYDNWSDINFSGGDLNTTQRYSVGAEFIPKDRAANNYLSRIRYRMGGHYKNDYISVSDYDIYNYGITFGLGLPLNRSKTMINVSFEYGQRNTSSATDYTESYGRVNVNFSLHEFWFAKRKLD